MLILKRIGYVLVFSLMLYCTSSLYAQGLTGPEQTAAGVKTFYQFNDDYIIAEPRWVTEGATIQTSRSGAACFAEVIWQNSGTYMLQFYDGNILLASVSVEVTEGCTPPPTPDAGMDQTGPSLCGKNSVVLQGSAIPENAIGYWSIVSGAGGSFSDPASPGAVFSGLTATDYVLSWSVGRENCFNSDQVRVRFNAAPTDVPSVTGDVRFGPGQFSLTASGAPVTVTYQWLDAEGHVIGTGTNFTTDFISVQQPRFGIARMIDSNGCTGESRAISLYMEPQPVVEASATILPEGGEVLLSVKGAYDLYIWKDSQNELIGTGPELWISEPGKFFVEVTKAGVAGFGCSLPVEVRAPYRVNARSKQIIENPRKATGSFGSLDVSELGQTIRYLDGLGRPLQEVNRAWSPDREDRIQPFVYDSRGRNYRTFLPVISEGVSGEFRNDLLDENLRYTAPHLSFFKDAFPYTETIFEDSPLDKPLETIEPGMNWKVSGRSKKFSYSSYVNGTGPAQEQVIAWELSTRTGLPARRADQQGFIKNGFYSSGTIEIRSEKDEQGLEIRTYLDTSGKIILRKIQATVPAMLNVSSHWAQTYYIYDASGKLRYVLQPELVQLLVQANRDPLAAELASMGFRYRYDPLGRVITLQEPGKDSVYMIYDHRDRVVLTQDGNQRVAAPYRWTFFKYDEMNRMIATGVKDTTVIMSQPAMQAVVNSFYQKNVNMIPYEQFIGYAVSNIHGYSNRTYPVITTGKLAEPDNYLQLMYYDQYSFAPGLINSTAFISDDIAGTLPWTASLAGAQTGKKIKVLDGGLTGGSTWLGTVIYYDRSMRPIQIHAENYKGGVDITSLKYDFTGLLLRRRRIHQTQDMNWRDEKAIYQQGNKLICTNSKSGWTSGSASVQSLTAGRDGWLEFMATERGTIRAVGLADQITGTNYTSIDYAFYLNSNGTINIFEQAAGKFLTGNFGTYRSGDRFKIERRAGVIRYFKNDVLLRTSAYPSTTILFADVAMSSPGATIAGIRSSFSTGSLLIEERYITDHQGRVTEIWHKTGQNPEVLLAKNQYDQQGRLSSKSMHAKSVFEKPKQKIDYGYHIRGWLVSINNGDGSTTETAAEFPDLFNQEIFYETVNPVGLNNSPRFNGQISSIRFNDTSSDGSAFNMNYDPMNRFSSGIHLNFSSGYGWVPSGNEERVTAYDLNGNIRSLIRKEKNVITDDLTYLYPSASNQLSAIQDRSTEKFKSFIDGAASSSEYAYDRNGNISSDLNKGLSQLIQYNALDLPEVINRGGNRVQYVYSADGERLTETILYPSGSGWIQKEWVGPVLYEQNVLHSVEHSDGRIMIQQTEAIFNEDGTNRNAYVLSGSSISPVTLNSKNYLAITSSSTTARSGIQTIGGSIPVISGERYRVRIRGYRIAGSSKTSNPVFISAKLNGADLLWPGASVASSAVTEHEVEQVLNIPADGLLQIGLTWNTVTAGEVLYLNRVEISKLTTGPPDYQYFLKDHLDNIRTVFTADPKTKTRLATLEPENNFRERKEFLRFDQARMVTSSLFDRTNGDKNGTAIRLNGSANERYGIASSLSVMPGDIIEAEVWVKFVDPSSTNWTSLFSSLMSLIVSGSSTVVKDGAAYATSTSSFPYGSIQHTTGSSGSGPKAYLNWLVFDRNYKLLADQSGFIRMSDLAREYGQDVAHERLRAPSIHIRQSGFVYIYLSNEESAPLDVYFDDFSVTHRHSPVIQTIDYLPFGSSYDQQVRENQIPASKKFNSMEELNALELGWLKPERYRTYDPLNGRFMQLDPVVKDHESLYAWNTNDPVRYADPFGADSAQRARALREAERYVKNNPDPGGIGGYGFAGFHAGAPGKPIDCSGMVSQCADVSGFGTLNNYVRGKPNNTGVKNILEQPLTREIPVQEITEGNIIVFPDDSHVGFISNIVRDKQRKVTGFTLIHSERIGGPNKDLIDLNNSNNYYVRKYLGLGGARARFYAWDTPDRPVTPQQKAIKK